MGDFLLRNARLPGDRGTSDVLVEGGRIAQVGPRIGASAAAERVDLGGRWLMPGLWDAHVHFTQWARHRGRVDLSGATSAADAAATLLSQPVPLRGPIVGRGFQDALWPDALGPDGLRADLLDRGGVSVVAVSHDLHCVWLNDAAAALLGAPHAGVLRERDAFAAEIALDEVMGSAEPLVAAAASAAAARGLVGVRDLEFADNVEAWTERVASGLDLLRVEACIYPERLGASDGRGLAGGEVVPGTGGLVSVGGLKIFTDGALNTRTALTHEPYGSPGSAGHAAHEPAALAELVAAARDRRLEAAVHAIGDLAVTRALDAFEATGARGSIEHAQLVARDDLPRFARLGVTASVQPQHAIDDRDVADAVWPDRSDRAFAYRNLLEAGAKLVLGSDAPVAELDPWVTIAAAVSRTDDDRRPWHPEQELGREDAIAASTRSALEVGAVADLIAVEADPLAASAQELRRMSVALTLVGGRVTHSELA